MLVQSPGKNTDGVNLFIFVVLNLKVMTEQQDVIVSVRQKRLDTIKFISEMFAEAGVVSLTEKQFDTLYELSEEKLTDVVIKIKQQLRYD